MINFEQQKALFIEISNRIKERIEIYAIGGTAMMFYGLKNSTLDIDLVFGKKEEREAFKKAAISLGYRELDSKIVYKVGKNVPEMLSLADSRLDLFLTDIIDFKFSENMKKRASQINEFGKNLVVKIADLHDIILMKCATNRIKDEDDVISIIKNNKIDWEILVKEAQEQLSLGKESALLDLGSLLEKLKNKHKLDVPQKTIDRLWILLKKQINSKIKS